MAEKHLAELVEKSSSTDVQVLLTVKEQLKREMLADPANASLSAAFERADKNLNAAMQKQKEKEKAQEAEAQKQEEEKKTFSKFEDVLAYIKGQGRKVGRSKLYNDINKHRHLPKQMDGTIRLSDVKDYMTKLPLTGTPPALAEKIADRQGRKEEAEIRRIQAVADREEFNLDVLRGKYIAKELLHQELAVRAVALRDGLKNAAETHASELVELVQGDPKHTPALLENLSRIFDECMGDYARPITIEVNFMDVGDEN